MINGRPVTRDKSTHCTYSQIVQVVDINTETHLGESKTKVGENGAGNSNLNINHLNTGSNEVPIQRI